jgi:hypothetical protein
VGGEVVKERVERLVFEGIVRGQGIKRDGIKVRVEEVQEHELAEKIKVAVLTEKVVVKKAGFKGFVEEVRVGQVSAESSSSLRWCVVSGFCEEIVAEAVVNWGGFETIEEVIGGIEVGEVVAFEVFGAEEAGVKKGASQKEEDEGCSCRGCHRGCHRGQTGSEEVSIGVGEAGVKSEASQEEEQEGCYVGGTFYKSVFMEVGVVIGTGQQGGGGRHRGEVSEGRESQC